MSDYDDPLAGTVGVAADPAEGALYFAGPGFSFSGGCRVYRLVPPATQPTVVFTSRHDCYIEPLMVRWINVAVGLAPANGHLYMVQESLNAVQDINLATGQAIDLPGTSDLKAPRDIVAGADGALYVLADGRIHRVSRTTGGAAVFAEGITGPTLAADAHGHLFAGINNTVVSFDLATGKPTTVVGRTNDTEIVPGPLPGAIISPGPLAALPSDDLLLLDLRDLVLLRARF
jgi:DNA-binding beta-propeller fold protein YncE